MNSCEKPSNTFIYCYLRPKILNALSSGARLLSLLTRWWISFKKTKTKFCPSNDVLTWNLPWNAHLLFICLQAEKKRSCEVQFSSDYKTFPPLDTKTVLQPSCKQLLGISFPKPKKLMKKKKERHKMSSYSSRGEKPHKSQKEPRFQTDFERYYLHSILSLLKQSSNWHTLRL